MCQMPTANAKRKTRMQILCALADTDTHQHKGVCGCNQQQQWDRQRGDICINLHWGKYNFTDIEFLR